MAKIIMAVIDCETNGLTTNYSVLSAGAIKFEYDTKTRESTIISGFNYVILYHKKKIKNRYFIVVNIFYLLIIGLIKIIKFNSIKMAASKLGSQFFISLQYLVCYFLCTLLTVALLVHLMFLLT